MARLTLSLLGPFEALLDAQPVAGFASDKVRALLAYLAVESDRAHPRETLAALLWPEWPGSAALTNLRHALSNLRQILHDADASEPHLLISRDAVQYNMSSEQTLDVFAFESALAGDDQLEQAAALYRGDFLEGFALKDAPEFDDWALLTRERLRRGYLSLLQRLASAEEGRGQHERAIGYARRRVELEPTAEEGQRELMRLLALSGRRSEALAQYESCRQALKDELGVAPDAETTQLYERIRDGEIGPHAEKRSRLPTPLRPLIGRERDLAELLQRLRDPACRLVSLVGLGGSGKTRLALEAARIVEGEFARGAHLVPLSAVETADGLVPAIAQGIEFAFYSQQSPKQQLLDYLRDKELLLVLDSCEHLLAGAPLIAEILTVAPKAKALATTRARLGLQGEQILPLGGLALTPSPSPLGEGRAPRPLSLWERVG